jgi:hypothetical protein
MPALSNPKHEIFAQEIAKGKSQVEAYELAGFKNGQKNAHRLGSDEGILRRVAEIQSERAEIERQATEKAAEALSIDKQWVMARLIDNATRAAASEDYSPSNKALELLGKELGMFIDRKNVNLTGDPTTLTDAQLVAILEATGGPGDAEAEDDPSSVH